MYNKYISVGNIIYNKAIESKEDFRRRTMSDLQQTIEDAFERRADITPRNVETHVSDAVMEAVAMLDSGAARVAARWACPDPRKRAEAPSAARAAYRIRLTSWKSNGSITQASFLPTVRPGYSPTRGSRDVSSMIAGISSPPRAFARRTSAR